MQRKIKPTAMILAGTALTLSCAAFAAAPPNYPNKPVRLIAANSAGGGLDIVARAISPKLAAVFGYQVVVDNRAGAAGSLASEITAHAPADGHTVMVGSLGGLAVNTNLYKGLNYHPLRDLAPVTFATSQSNVLVVNPSVPVKTVHELIALLRAQPGKLTYGSSGAGNAGHLAAELFKIMTKTEMVHVPYKGGAPAMIDLIAGQVQVVFSSAPTAVPQVKAGKVRGIAVTTLRRSTALPELPTLAESGLPGYEADNWYGIVTTAGTPRPIVDYLNAEIVRAMQTADVKELLFKQGLEVHTSTPAEFGAYMKSEFDKWAKVIKDAGISAN
ncbi:MAG TPA: tripartite tricarboxylate transporter substrate binding protein [Burkholderiales bacterium]|nr:tripartite tricarboxylate transporter substrate binding protein [Burkholderiales bacterium]